MKIIQHLFFDRHFASSVWNIVHITFRIQPPTNLFGSWVPILSPKLRKEVLLGAAALCWVIRLNRNDMIFNETKPNTFMYR